MKAKRVFGKKNETSNLEKQIRYKARLELTVLWTKINMICQKLMLLLLA